MAVYKRNDTKSKRWYYKFEIDGVTYKKGIPTARTRAQALQAESEARRAVHEGRYGTRGGQMLFGVFVKTVYLPHAEQHHRNYANDLRITKPLCEYFGGYRLGQISPLAIEGFKQKRAKSNSMYGTPYKPRSINLEIAVLSAIFSYPVTAGQMRENPCRKVKRLPVPEDRCRVLSVDEERHLLQHLENERPFLWPLVHVAIGTGFRMCELLALKKSAIDFARGRIHVVNPKWARDKRKTEGNPMEQATRKTLQELCRTTPGEYVFTDEKGEPLRKSVIDNAFRKACHRAGIFDLNFHALRHTFGTRLAEADVNLKKIARLRGHSTTKTTEIYVHPTDEGPQDAVEWVRSPRIVPGRVSDISEQRAKAV